MANADKSRYSGNRGKNRCAAVYRIGRYHQSGYPDQRIHPEGLRMELKQIKELMTAMERAGIKKATHQRKRWLRSAFGAAG